MFIDLVKLTVQAGAGGAGLVSFRREKHIARGGPDGGNGGQGGHVLALADNNQSSLAKFRYQPKITASPGQSGGSNLRQGGRGQDRLIKVPPGTVICDEVSGQTVADLTSPGQAVVIAKGGPGGFGNAHFKSSVRRQPLVAEKGAPGQIRQLRLELKLIADIGLVGLPNAGKSTFLEATSNARPRIAAYPFTTLTPNLGVADFDNQSLLLADIPGLIEGASQGRGLGHQFLRHIERTRAIFHLIDINQTDAASAYNQIRQELRAYSPTLAALPEVVALSKSETVGPDQAQACRRILAAALPPNTRLLLVSAHAGRNLQTSLRQLRQTVDRQPAPEPAKAELPVFNLAQTDLDRQFTVVRQSDHFLVTGSKIEGFAAKTRFEDYHGRNRLRHILDKLGIRHELLRQGYDNQAIVVGQPEIGRLELTEEHQQ